MVPRSLICFFSRSGLTKRVVDVLRSKIRSDLFEIKSSADYSGVSGFLRGCLHALWGGPLLQDPLPDFSAYRTVIVAGPVWGGLSAPLVAFLEAADFGGKNVISLATAGGHFGKYNEDFGSRVKNGQYRATEGFLAVQRETDETLDAKVNAWIRAL
jgi:flavodoxin